MNNLEKLNEMAQRIADYLSDLSEDQPGVYYGALRENVRWAIDQESKQIAFVGEYYIQYLHLSYYGPQTIKTVTKYQGHFILK